MSGGTLPSRIGAGLRSEALDDGADRRAGVAALYARGDGGAASGAAAGSAAPPPSSPATATATARRAAGVRPRGTAPSGVVVVVVVTVILMTDYVACRMDDVAPQWRQGMARTDSMLGGMTGAASAPAHAGA
eukprot:gene12789-15536_t